MFINEDCITYADDVVYFKKESLERELSADEILSIEVTVSYRPFKDKEECWQEMQKHQPFGWIVEPATNHSKDIAILFEYNTMFHDDIIFKINFNLMFKNYKFTDGTPFGIMEE